VDEQGAYLFKPATRELKRINGAGQLIWSLCDGTRDHAEIVEILARSNNSVNAERLEGDARAFLSGLAEHGFLILASQERG